MAKIIAKEEWKDLMTRMKDLGYEYIQVGFSGGHDQGYCDEIEAKIGKGHQSFKEGTMLGEGHRLDPDSGKWIPLEHKEALLVDFKLLTGTDDFDDDNSPKSGEYVLKEVNGERRMVYETIPWPENPGPMNLFARFIYAEYGGFATETEVRGHVRVNASEGTVIYDNNWMEWKNHNEIKQLYEE
tara:strand:- start:3238 stop:3789 length:552 start_codon:yes stop_codon:yes gene_type:complete